MASPKGWEKIVEEGSYHTGGGIMAEMHRWKMQTPDGEFRAYVEVVLSEKGSDENGGQIELHTVTGEMWKREGMLTHKAENKTKTREGLMNAAMAFMRDNSSVKELQDTLSNSDTPLKDYADSRFNHTNLSKQR